MSWLVNENEVEALTALNHNWNYFEGVRSNIMDIRKAKRYRLPACESGSKKAVKVLLDCLAQAGLAERDSQEVHVEDIKHIRYLYRITEKGEIRKADLIDELENKRIFDH